MGSDTPAQRWALLAGALSVLLVLVAALPLAAQGPRAVFLPVLITTAPDEPEVTPQVLRIARVVLRGEGAGDNSDEYVQIMNVSAAPASLGGVRLSGGTGLTPTRPFVFPTVALPAGASAVVFSKPGSDNPEAGLFYLDGAPDLWRMGAVAELRDAQGRLLSRLAVPARPPVPQPTATPIFPTPTISPIGSLEISDIVLKDPAFPNESEEYVQIRNAGGYAVDMTGWRLTNATRGGQVPPFIFPAFTIGIDVTIAVFSAIDEDDLESGDFFWDQAGEVWRVGDRAELRDAQGTLVDSLIVPNQ